MIEYPKIETLFERNPERMKEIIPWQFRLPEFTFVDKWHITEKLDGTNVRLTWDSEAETVTFRGRSDNAQFSAQQIEWLTATFPSERFSDAFPYSELLSAVPDFVTVYGEFYGPKIQSGGWYRSDFGFRIFDVRIGDWWLAWDNIADVARKLDVLTVPVLATNINLEGAVSLVNIDSVTAFKESALNEGRVHEGIIARTNPDLYIKDGRRLMWKLKVRDLPPTWNTR